MNDEAMARVGPQIHRGKGSLNVFCETVLKEKGGKGSAYLGVKKRNNFTFRHRAYSI